MTPLSSARFWQVWHPSTTHRGSLRMPETRPRVLFVDDEPNIRLTLGMYLEDQGFEVVTAATVPEALKLITDQSFDVLIADLNVGQAGDGFTVVSAMRRTQPRAVTFILTGYPAFETALEAIRLQVDDYITKPTDTETLAGKIRTKLAEPKPEHHVESKRLTEIMAAHIPEIAEAWLDESRADPMLGAIQISDEARTDHIPRVLDVAFRMSRGENIAEIELSAARDHGIIRRKQGFTIPLLLREARLLHNVIGNCMQDNLLSIQISYLIPDMLTIHETVQKLLEESVSAFLEPAKKK
jgi:DNA-binding response OmpR family regulator